MDGQVRINHDSHTHTYTHISSIWLNLKSLIESKKLFYVGENRYEASRQQQQPFAPIISIINEHTVQGMNERELFEIH